MVTELLNDPEVSATLEGIPYPYYRAYADHWIPTHETLFKKRGELHLAIELNSSGALLGAVGLLPKSERDPRHLGYWLGRRYWGKGYATEALREFIRFARVDLGAQSIAARCMVDNAASIAVLAKIGLQRVGRSAQPLIKDGHPHELDEFLLEGGSGERAV